ncbi:MAG: YdcF family protein [Chloroflexi bacterium]|nr:YdcF family protein [Chloroflexota bacterium]
MFKKIIKFIWGFVRILSLVALVVLFIPKLIVLLSASTRTFSVDKVPSDRVAIVFGAGLRYDGTPTAILKDRVETAVQLYQQGTVTKLLMSGDNSYVDYNEPEAMRQYALSLGVPDQDIVLDYAGRRTYDTCYRAKEIFQLESAILVTQSFHLPRALFLCNALGVEANGVAANNIYFRKISRFIWNVRELFATTQAVWDVYVTNPLPILGDPEPIQ